MDLAVCSICIQSFSEGCLLWRIVERCVCVCVCTVYKVGEEERRGLRDEVRREGNGEGEGLQ